MRIIETELWPQQAVEPYGEGIYIGLVDEACLAGLTEGESIILRETNDIEVDVIVHRVMLNGRAVWFGALTSQYRDIRATAVGQHSTERQA